MSYILKKNICESIVDTLFNISSKTDDKINARLFLVELDLQLELVPSVHGKQFFFTPQHAKHYQSNKKNCFVGVTIQI